NPDGPRHGRRISWIAEGGSHLATCAEAGVKRAIAVVARQCELGTPIDVGVPGHYNFSVRPYGSGKPLSGDSEAGYHFATRAAAGVERAVAVVACQRETDETVRNGPPSRDDFPVQLQGDGTCTVIRAREVHDYFPARAEAGVECAIGIIARQREVGWAVNIG